MTPWTATCQASLSFTISWSSLKLMSIKPVIPSNHFILCHPLLLLPSIFPRIRVFSNKMALPIRWPKYWSFNFSISPSNEYSGLVSFRLDWLDLFAVQGTLKSLPVLYTKSLLFIISVTFIASEYNKIQPRPPFTLQWLLNEYGTDPEHPSVHTHAHDVSCSCNLHNLPLYANLDINAQLQGCLLHEAFPASLHHL